MPVSLRRALRVQIYTEAIDSLPANQGICIKEQGGSGC